MSDPVHDFDDGFACVEDILRRNRNPRASNLYSANLGFEFCSSLHDVDAEFSMVSYEFELRYRVNGRTTRTWY